MRLPKRFSGASQLLGLGLEGVESSRALVALPPEPGLPAALAPLLPGAAYLYHDHSVYSRDLGQEPPDSGREFVFAPVPDPAWPPLDFAAVFLPKGKLLTEMIFAGVSRVLEPGARVMVVGHKKSGIKSSRPLIERCLGPVEDSRPGRHCVLLRARKTVNAPELPAPARFQVRALGREIEVVTMPGVFSFGRLDPGTQMLLDRLPTRAVESALDWGCGSGVIGAALMLANPGARVALVDSHVMALESARATLEANGLDPGAAKPDPGPELVGAGLDLIVSNPPFHSGRAVDCRAAERFFTESRDMLSSGGELLVVANAFIKYESVLGTLFERVEVVEQDPSYKVLRASAPVKRAAGGERRGR